MKTCSCGSTEFRIEVDNGVIKICCIQCNTVNFPDEVADSPDRNDKD